MENWHNTDELDDLLGSELDLDQAWSEFKKDKKKTRRIPFWWCFGIGSILLLGMVWFFGSNINLKMYDKETAANLLHPSPSVSSLETPNLPLEKEKYISQKEISPASVPIIKRGKPATEKKQVGEEVSNSVVNPIERSGEQEHSILKEHTTIASLVPLKEKLLEHTVTTNNLSRSHLEEATTISSLKLFLSPYRLETIFPPIEQRPSKFQKKWSIGITYAIANAHRNLSGGQEVYTQRRQEEQFLEANRMGFSVTKHLSKSFFLRSGLLLSQYRSKLEEDIQTITSPVSYENVVTETHTQNNLTQEIIGTAEGSQLTINRFTRFQQYQTVSLPLQVGVQLPLFPNWQLRANTGVAISVFSQTKGQTFSSALPDGLYAPLTQLEYRQVGLLEGMGQLSVERSFGNTSLSLGLHGTMDLNNRFKNTTYGIDKFRSYGLQIGIHRTF